jgi:hypothetical protein
MTLEAFLLQRIHDDIARLDDAMQARIAQCYRELRASCLRYGLAGNFAVARLGAEVAVYATPAPEAPTAPHVTIRGE